MKAIILAAGDGAAGKLGDACKDIPKCLVEINNASLLEIQIDTLHACGVEDIIVVTGYRADKINMPGVRYYNNKDYARTNVLYSLFRAAGELDNDCLVLYSDILFEEDIIRRIAGAQHDIALGVMVNWREAFKQRKEVSAADLEMVSYDSENRVTGIGKLLKNKDDKSTGLFNGILRLSKHGTDILKRNYDRMVRTHAGGEGAPYIRHAWLTDLLQEMAWLGVPMHCVINETGWIEIETREDYERALMDTGFIRRFFKMKTDWKKRANSYNNLKWVNRNDLLNAMVGLMDAKPGDSVLDMGTGTGKVLSAVKRRFPFLKKMHGVDKNTEMMAKIPGSGGFRLSVGDIEKLDDFGDKNFDFILARMVIHHCHNPARAVKEAYRLLKKGGRFILCEGNPPNRLCLPFYKEMFLYKEERWSFLESDLVSLLLEQNFKNITTKTFIYKNSSLNNWLANSGLPRRNIDIIRRLHLECDEQVRKAYRMRFVKGDVLMEWKFSVVYGDK